MAYEIVIGDRMYSSWSLRGWLMFTAFNIPVSTRLAPMLTPEFQSTLEEFPPARLVPAVRAGGQIVWDTMAIAETLAEKHPGLWPEDPADRAMARSLAAEMHSGFPALRSVCPMNLRCQFETPKLGDDVKADLSRLEELWALPGARGTAPWLFGAYSLADAFFAPVAARIAGYDLPMSRDAKAYVASHLAHGPFRRWRAMAFVSDRPMDRYEDNGLARNTWPGPVPVTAEAISSGTPLNATCPYSGKPPREDSLARIDGKIIGFCNQFCRDKSVADPDAWPELKELRARLSA